MPRGRKMIGVSDPRSSSASRRASCVECSSGTAGRFRADSLNNVTINQLATHPVSNQLGIHTQTVHGAFRIEADLVQLANGQILWTA